MMRVSIGIIITVVMSLLLVSDDLTAQNVYELRQLTDDDWLDMSTDERLNALNISNNHSYNQTFIGEFGRDYDRYQRWGYDYYELEDRYENYAFRGFENYSIVEQRREKWYYNQFGDRLTKMTRNGYIWSETIRDDGLHGFNAPVGFINQQVFDDGIWVARESTEDWAISVVGARAIRARLTPLTFSIPNYTGMKVDFQSENYTVSIVNAIMFGKDVFEKGQRGDKIIPATEANSLFIRGLQLRRKFGGLTLGATYANMHNIQMNRNKGNDLRGNVNQDNPTPMVYAVRIVDDSPHDGDGPTVQNVKLIVDGKYRPDIVPTVLIDDLRREKVTAVKAKAEQEYLFGRGPTSTDPLTVDEDLMKYLDYLYYTDYTKGVNTEIVSKKFDINKGKEYYKYIDPGTKPIQVSGNEYIVYLFDISSIGDEVRRVQVELTVSNDYRVQTSTIYTVRPGLVGHSEDGNKYMTHYNAEYWRTMAQADGNIKDGSNLRTITIDYGFEVANMIYGFDAHFNYLGFVVNAEFVTNTHYYMFKEGAPGTGRPKSFNDYISEPDLGHRSTQTDNAYYITVQKDWERWGFAGEVFKMGKFYRPYMNWFIPDEVSTRSTNHNNDTVRWSMVEDNDDDDQYPDTQTIQKAMAYRVGGFNDPDGVFPGNDLDKDGYPDNEKNANRIPDYYEPFLMFDVDPDEFIFGDDFNNNTIPDHREDDMKYDVPYDLDRKGQHFYLMFKPIKDVNLFVGSFKTRGVGLDNRTDNTYFKANLDYNVYTVGKLYAEYRYERIHDNFQDKFVIVGYGGKYVAHGGSRSYGARSLYYDEVEFRNSKVQKVYVDLKLRASPAITLENHVRFERNDQVEGTMYDNTYQPGDVISTIAMINKFAYTKQLGNWVFTPGVKFRLYKKGRSESLNPLDHYLLRIPVIYLKYVFSPKTTLTFGMQGIKGFEMKYKDYIQSRNDYKQINYLLQIENRTKYFGFDLWGGFGFMLEEVKYDEAYRAFEEYKSSSFFVRMWLGY